MPTSSLIVSQILWSSCRISTCLAARSNDIKVGDIIEGIFAKNGCQKNKDQNDLITGFANIEMIHNRFTQLDDLFRLLLRADSLNDDFGRRNLPMKDGGGKIMPVKWSNEAGGIWIKFHRRGLEADATPDRRDECRDSLDTWARWCILTAWLFPFVFQLAGPTGKILVEEYTMQTSDVWNKGEMKELEFGGQIRM